MSEKIADDGAVKPGTCEKCGASLRNHVWAGFRGSLSDSGGWVNCSFVVCPECGHTTYEIEPHHVVS